MLEVISAQYCERKIVTRKKRKFVMVQMSNVGRKILPDTGSGISIINETTLKDIGKIY